MKLITFLMLLMSCFVQCFFYSEYLTKITIYNSYILKIPVNQDSKIKYNLVEIFSPFDFFNYGYFNNFYKNVNQANVTFKNEIETSITLYSSIREQNVWFRVIGLKSLIPGNFIVNNDIWSNSFNIKTNNATLQYELYALPIYPSGNIKTWSSDFKSFLQNKEAVIIEALNKSIGRNYLMTCGDLLYNTTTRSGSLNFKVATRINRDFFLILAAYDNNNEYIQYPPVYMKGCLTLKSDDKSCQLLSVSYPMNIVLISSLVFIGFAFKYDLIHVLFCSWIIVGIIVLTVWDFSHYTRSPISSTFYITFLIITSTAGIICAILCYFISKRYSRLRILLTAFLISLILVSIIWFTPFRYYRRDNITLFYAVSAAVGFVLVIMLLVCNHITSTIGSVFVGTVLISISISINNLNGSIFPFLFIDFYNSIVYSSVDWIYYSPLLLDDLIIIILCPTLSLIFGFIMYRIFKRYVLKENGNGSNTHCWSLIFRTGIPGLRQVAPRNINYETVELTISNTPEITANIIINVPNTLPLNDDSPPPLYNVNPTFSNNQLNDIPDSAPPSYDECVKAHITPTAPLYN